jgi:glucose-6-phosphate 1-dehydrogenase
MSAARMSEPQSDALVLFGATGDLAYEQIFPALQAMTRRGHLDAPVIGVAMPDWTVEQLRTRAQQSIAANGTLDPGAFGRLAARLSYVAGDYQEPATFDRLRQAIITQCPAAASAAAVALPTPLLPPVTMIRIVWSVGA